MYYIIGQLLVLVSYISSPFERCKAFSEVVLGDKGGEDDEETDDEKEELKKFDFLGCLLTFPVSCALGEDLKVPKKDPPLNRVLVLVLLWLVVVDISLW